MSWDHDTWVKAWGWNAPLINGGTNDEVPYNCLPRIPEQYRWTLFRELVGEKNPQPGWYLILSMLKPVKDQNAPTAWDLQSLATAGCLSSRDLGETQRALCELAETMVKEAHVK